MIKGDVMEGIVISNGTSKQMTTDYRLFTTGLISHSASNSYKRWPGVLENMELPKAGFWKTTQPNKYKYTQILEKDVTGTDKNVIIKKQEWIVTDSAMELEIEVNYNNKLR